MNLTAEKNLRREKRAKTTEELIAELYRTEGKAEIINGKVVKLVGTGDAPGTAAGNIFVSLKVYQRQTGRGIAYGDSVGFLVDLPHRKSFSPDACFFVGQRTGMKFLQGAPIFAVEVRSEHDYGEKAEQKIADKRRDYFAAGTEIVWDVDLQSADVIRSFHRDAPNDPQIFRRGGAANAEPALPGWTMPVDELFE